ncbi:hypothetical protein CPB86DRAFT_830616, partial [Serendipita vermifera]
MILTVIIALFWSRLAISQLLLPQYSCRTCNVVDLFLKENNYGLSSVCMPMSCDASTVTSLRGPSCISPRGESLVCNGTATLGWSGWSGWNGHSVICNCDGPVSLTGNLSIGRLTIDPDELSGYQPTDCLTTSEGARTTEGACKFEDNTKIYSYYDVSHGGSYTTRCLPLFYPPSNPQAPYYLDGTPLICDGFVHVSLTNTSYVCKLGQNLDADTVLSFHNSTNRSASPHLYDCTSIHDLYDVMVNYRQALDR